MSSVAEHLEACHPCRYGVNCFEWYRLHERAPDWCELCSVEHFSSYREMLLWMDAITVVGSWLMLSDAMLMINGYTRLTFVGEYYPIGSISTLPFISFSGEYTEWIRGHHAPDSPQAKALLVAAALAA